MKITFSTDTAAFEEYGMAFQTRHIFQDILGGLERREISGVIKDLDGNKIGKWEVTTNDQTTSV